MKNQGVKRGKGKRRKKVTKQGLLKEDVTVFVPVEDFDIFSQGEDRESCDGLSWWWTLWRSLRTCLTVCLVLVRMCMWCLM